MPEYPIDPDLAALSDALGGLSPATPALNRDRLLYEAGRRAAGRRGWQLATGFFALLAVGLGLRLMTISVPPATSDALASRERQRPEEARASSSAVADTPSSPVLVIRSSAAPYLQLRDEVVRFGPDNLPGVRATTSHAISPESPPVERLLGLPRGALDNTLKSRWEHQLSRGDV